MAKVPAGIKVIPAGQGPPGGAGAEVDGEGTALAPAVGGAGGTTIVATA